MCASRENDGAGFVDIPFTMIAAAADAPAVRAPAMTHNFQMKAGRAAQIGFERESFFLLAKTTQNPLYRKGARQKLKSNARIFKAAGGELQPGVQARSAQPMKIENAPFAGAGRLNPAQGFCSLAAVVSGKNQVPHPESRGRTDDIDRNQAPHKRPLNFDGTSDLGRRARGPNTVEEIFFAGMCSVEKRSANEAAIPVL